jgi:hypothetical protein
MGRLDQRQSAVVVAVRLVRVMKVALHQIVGMATVRHGIVAAAGSMLVPGIVPTARMRCRAARGVRTRHIERVLVDVAVVHVMQMAVVQVINVSSVLDLRMRTVGTMLVRMLVVNGVFHSHRYPV